MAKEPKQNELWSDGKGRIGSINHLRLTVTVIQRAERFYRPLMRFMEYELCDREEDRLAWAKWSSSGVFWLILTGARKDTKPARHDLLSPGFHHLAWNADKISRQKRSKTRGLTSPRYTWLPPASVWFCSLPAIPGA